MSKRLKKVEKLSIDRGRWVNGANRTGRNPSMMLNGQGNKCCLGFLASAEGLKDEELLYREYPKDCHNDIPLMSWHGKSTGFVKNAVDINDTVIDSVKRETLLRKLFREQGIKLTFRGKPLGQRTAHPEYDCGY